jgi:outer membrane protein insertion porin family
MVVQMSHVKYYVLLIFSYLSLLASEEFTVKKINLTCVKSKQCTNYWGYFRALENHVYTKESLAQTMKQYGNEVGIKTMNFNLDNESFELAIAITIKPHIESIQIQTEEGDDPFLFEESLQTKEDSFIDEEKVQQDLVQLTHRYQSMGYPQAKVTQEVKHLSEGELALMFHVNLGTPLLLNKITYRCKSGYVSSILESSFAPYLRKPYVREKLLQELSLRKKMMVDQGFYSLDIRLSTNEEGKHAELFLDCSDDQLVQIRLHVANEDQNDYTKFYRDLREAVTRVKKMFFVKEVQEFLQNYYLSKGYSAQVTSDVKISKNVWDDEVLIYDFHVTKKERIGLHQLIFRGNQYFTSANLQKLFFRNASDLTSAGYKDEAYFLQFTDKLRKNYIQEGFLNPSIAIAAVDNGTDKRGRVNQSIIIDVNEGIRTFIDSTDYNLGDITQEEKDAILAIFNVHAGEAFNPIAFDEAVSTALEYLKAQGYLEAKYESNEEKNFVQFDTSSNHVQLFIHVIPGPKIFLSHVYYVGLNKTLPITVERKLQIQEGDLVTTSFLEKVNTALASLSLFRNFQVKFIKDKTDAKGEYRDLYLILKERDYGTFELTPVFRTDLGLKLGAKLTYGNLLGKNHSLILDSQVNQRLDKSNVDPDRHDSLESMLEYDLRAQYNVPDLYKSYWDYSITLSASRKRYYSFDADTDRISNLFSKDINAHLSFSFRQQLEMISQYDALNFLDSGKFRIGSLTPSLTYDVRNNPAFATAGYQLSLSDEWARPEFLSSDSNNYDINFHRMVSRNKFYYSPGRDLVLAFSLTAGIEENLAGESGFIPTIKVLRLSGVDTVRGFSEGEINKQPDGKDLSDLFIQNTVYLTNVKFEPRYLYSDEMAFSLFWDAGKVQVGTFDPMDFRSSLGISFKYLTPVGTLDLDYGFKLLRKTYPDGTVESPGRIHISIGFF